MKLVGTHHCHLESIVGPGRLRISGSVHSSVTDEVSEWSGRLEGLKVGNKVSDALETSKLELHNYIGTIRHASLLGD